MTRPTTDPGPRDQPLLEAAIERKLAVDLFNATWTLLGITGRTVEQDDALVHCAHASRHHWGRVGGPENLARGEWQCSRVYSALGRSEPALHHAIRCHALCSDNGIADWDVAFAHEALARAYAVGDDLPAARAHTDQALATPIADAEDRELLLADLATIPRQAPYW